jgi:hypothetical protein
VLGGDAVATFHVIRDDAFHVLRIRRGVACSRTVHDAPVFAGVIVPPLAPDDRSDAFGWDHVGRHRLECYRPCPYECSAGLGLRVLHAKH